MQRSEPWLEQRAHRLYVQIARTVCEVRAAQRLRYEVFATEMGARLNGPEAGVDEDRFDAHCDHLLVREAGSGDVVGTYRILGPRAAERAGGYYSEQEFDFTRLTPLRSTLVEIGRFCVRADHRTGSAITLLWACLARYMLAGGHAFLVGCASLSMADGGRTAASAYRRIAARHLSPPEYRAEPFRRLPRQCAEDVPPVELPPLIRGYLKVGAYVCGEPAWDADFNTADLLMLLPLAQLNPRYARHYLGDAAARAMFAPPLLTR
jgi:putative hemolysin